MIREVNTSDADRASARAFFAALTEFWDLSSMDVLDAFARNGQLTVSNYAKLCASVDCWELEISHAAALNALGARSVAVGCSYDLAKMTKRRYDMVVIDTPQGIHQGADGEGHYEHFDFIEIAPRLLKKHGLVVVYVNKEPYDKTEAGDHGYDSYPGYDFNKWMDARCRFYGSPVITEEQALTAYRYKFGQAGYKIVRSLVTPCHSDVPGRAPYACRMALELRA